jgi:tRNA-specific 2-thiouridylase
MNRRKNSREKIMVAMSGGVDSSVSALLLQEQGHPIAGMFMKNWEEDDRFGACPAEEDAADAQAVADAIGIELHRRNFAAEYFRTDCRDGTHRLLRGLDPNKDQSYFLYTIGQEQLARTLFPVGELLKPEVREAAQNAALPVHDKKDSTGICFIGERNFKDFLSEYLPPSPGEIRTPGEQVIAEHNGLMYYTLGQRQGLGIGGLRDFSDEAWYVLHKDQERNILYAGQGHDHPWLFSTTLRAGQLSWVSGFPPEAGAKLTARVRYRQADQDCVVTRIGSDELVLEFGQPQRAVTAGQSVVLYDGENCLGGGIISWADTIPATRDWRQSNEVIS